MQVRAGLLEGRPCDTLTLTEAPMCHAAPCCGQWGMGKEKEGRSCCPLPQYTYRAAHSCLCNGMGNVWREMSLQGSHHTLKHKAQFPVSSHTVCRLFCFDEDKEISREVSFCAATKTKQHSIQKSFTWCIHAPELVAISSGAGSPCAGIMSPWAIGQPVCSRQIWNKT